MIGAEIDLGETSGDPYRAGTDVPENHTPEGRDADDAPDDNEALPDFEEGERGADGRVEDSINLSESNGPDLERNH